MSYSYGACESVMYSEAQTPCLTTCGKAPHRKASPFLSRREIRGPENLFAHSRSEDLLKKQQPGFALLEKPVFP
jgi:hypothetical protein